MISQLDNPSLSQARPLSSFISISTTSILEQQCRCGNQENSNTGSAQDRIRDRACGSSRWKWGSSIAGCAVRRVSGGVRVGRVKLGGQSFVGSKGLLARLGSVDGHHHALLAMVLGGAVHPEGFGVVDHDGEHFHHSVLRRQLAGVDAGDVGHDLVDGFAGVGESGLGDGVALERPSVYFSLTHKLSHVRLGRTGIEP